MFQSEAQTSVTNTWYEKQLRQGPWSCQAPRATTQKLLPSKQRLHGPEKRIIITQVPTVTDNINTPGID